MKSKGFTLVELLAVIAIMAILITLAVPSIIKLYNDAKKNAFKVEAESIIKAAEEGYAVSILSKDVEETTYTYTDGSESKTGNINMYISGNKPDNGEVKINAEGQVSIALHNGEYCATKDYLSKEVTIESSTLEECVTQVQTTPETCFITDLALTPEFIQTGYIDFESFPVEWLFQYGIILPSELEADEAIIYYYDYENPECPSDVIIPSTINGKNVVAIGLGAFAVLDDEGLPITGEGIPIYGMGITSVKLPDSIKAIAADSFLLNLLVEVDLPNALETVGDSAFHLNQLTSVTIPEKVTHISCHAFSYNQLSNVYFLSNLTTISSGAFENNQITSVTIPTTVIHINENSFFHNELTSIFIPNSVEYIGYGAFRNNYIIEADAEIDNVEGAVTIGDNAFENNGADGQTTIIPRYLRE